MSFAIDINFMDAGWEEQKHPRGKSGEHGGQFVKKGEADVTTNEHAKHAGKHPELHTTEALHKALTLLRKSKVDRGNRKVIQGELAKRALSEKAAAKPAAVEPTASQPKVEPATPKVDGKKGEADVTTNEHAKHVGKHLELYDTPALHKALTLLRKSKVDRGNRKVIQGELAKRALGEKAGLGKQVPTSSAQPSQQQTPQVSQPKSQPAVIAGGKMPEATGDPLVDTQTFIKLNQELYQKQEALRNATPEQEAAAAAEVKTAREMSENFELEMNDAAAVKNAIKQTSKPLSAPSDPADQFIRSAGLADSLGHYTLKLPKNTRLALRQYAGNAYHVVNGSLRYKMPLNRKMQGIVDNIDAWMQKPESRAKKSFVTYRGLDLSPEQSRALRKGATLFNPGYSSTSLSKDIAAGFAQDKFVMHVTVSAGTPVAYLGGCCSNGPYGAKEMEALLPRGIPMKVTGTRKGRGVTIIDVTV